jgi:hypothetical protein
MTAYSAPSLVQRFTYWKLELRCWRSKIITAREIFTRATFSAENDLNLYEEIHQNCVLHCGDRDLRDRAGGGPALMQDDRQKLPDE